MMGSFLCYNWHLSTLAIPQSRGHFRIRTGDGNGHKFKYPSYTLVPGSTLNRMEMRTRTYTNLQVGMGNGVIFPLQRRTGRGCERGRERKIWSRHRSAPLPSLISANFFFGRGMGWGYGGTQGNNKRYMKSEICLIICYWTTVHIKLRCKIRNNKVITMDI